MQASGSAVEIHNLWRIYRAGTSQEVAALRGLSLSIPHGRYIALKGRSGSGKTTLLNCISGLDRPTEGSVHVLDHDLLVLDDTALTEWRRHKIGLIFQSFGLIPTLSAYENVELVLRLAGADRAHRSARAHTCLDMVGLRKWADHRPYEMSGGQQQRVAIARALANQPAILIADEPTGELDSTTSREILTLFRHIVETEAITILMTSHSPITDEFVDEVLYLKDGVIVSGDTSPDPAR